MTSRKQFKLGDVVAKLAKALKIKHCADCEKRRLILNEIRRSGIRKTIKKLRAVGSLPPASREGGWTLQDIVNKMVDCCDE